MRVGVGVCVSCSAVTSPWALVVEQNSVGQVQVVSLTVVLDYPEAVQLGSSCNTDNTASPLALSPMSLP